MEDVVASGVALDKNQAKIGGQRFARSPVYRRQALQRSAQRYQCRYDRKTLAAHGAANMTLLHLEDVLAPKKP